MQSYIKYKEYYDRKAKTAPLKENEYCFGLQSNTYHQGSKHPFKDYRWGGPFIVQKVLPNENYIIRRLTTNKTQKLQQICLENFVPNKPLENNFREERLQPDEEIVIPQDDLYTITWETNFGEQLATRGNEPFPIRLPKGEQPVTSNSDSKDAHENEVDYKIVNDSPNATNDAAHKRNERLNDDVSKRNEDTEAEKNETFDWPNPAVYP